MDDLTLIENPDSIMEEILAHNEEHVLIFQPPKETRYLEQMRSDGHGRFSGYQYTPLQDGGNIRLLKCLPAADSNEMIFELAEHVLDNVSGEFIAVSYCWGGEPTENLLLSNGTFLNITPTAISLLRHVSATVSGLPIWIDAICINQKDPGEKTAQVKMMREIYGKAQCVLVWLGNGRISQADELHIWSYLSSLKGNYSTPIPGLRGIERLGEVLFGRLLQSPWFERVWVIQEVCFARNVMFLCGAVGMSLPFLKDYLEMRRENYKHAPDTYFETSGSFPAELPAFRLFQRLCNHRELIRENGGQARVSLTDILFAFQACKATEQIDKVFALLGLADCHEVLPDYALSIAEAYTQAMIACAPSLYDFRLLGYAGLANLRAFNGAKVKGLGMIPTWVPDFSCHFSVTPFTVRGDYKATPARDLDEAVQESKEKVHLMLSDNLGLRIRVRIIDTIEELSMHGPYPVGSQAFDYGTVLQCQYHMSNEGIRMLECRNRSESASLVCYDTMTAGGLRDNDGMSIATKVAGFESFQKSKGTARQLPQTQAEDDINELHGKMHRSGIGRSRRLFVTSKGYLGMANNDILEGDLVCLVFGAPVPFILRGPITSRDQFPVYHLVCDAYVNGIMYGEKSSATSSSCKTILLE